MRSGRDEAVDRGMSEPDEDDGWAPLQPQMHRPHPAMRPAPDPSRLPRAAIRPGQAPSGEVPAGMTAALDPEQVLAQMRRQLAAGRRSGDPLQSALRRRDRRARAAASVGLQAIYSDEVDGGRVQTVGYSAGRDSRQDETWFRELPVAEQQRLLARWRIHDEVRTLDVAGQRRRLLRRCGTAALVLGSFGLLAASLFGVGIVATMVAVGVISAAIGHALGGGAWTMASCGAVVFLALQWSVLGSSIMHAWQVLLLLVSTFGMGVVGHEAEIEARGFMLGRRRSGSGSGS